MSAPLTPTPVYLQQANNQVLLSWEASAGATSYSVKRSTDNITFSVVATPTALFYLDTSVTQGTTYYYQVAASNGTLSAYSTVQSIVPVTSGKMTLGQIRLLAQERADRVNSNFVTLPEWNTYINQSAYELYDLLITVYEDYFVYGPVSFPTTGTSNAYSLPNGILSFTDLSGNSVVAPPLYKLLGVDMGQGNLNNARFTVNKFNFIDRNNYVFPQVNSNYLGVFNSSYRVLGDNIQFIPTPAGNQLFWLWYYPRLTLLLKDSDILDGISGWSEYIVVDAARKALLKEESDVTALSLEKEMLKKRIEESAMNRDAGQPDTISDTRRFDPDFNGYNGAMGGGWAGY